MWVFYNILIIWRMVNFVRDYQQRAMKRIVPLYDYPKR